MATGCDDSTDPNNQFGEGYEPNCKSNLPETESLDSIYIRVLADKYETAMKCFNDRHYATALMVLNDVFKRRSDALGPTHEDTLDAQTKIGLIHCIENRLDEAVRVFQKIYDIKVEKFGPKHKETELTAVALSRLLRKQSKFEEAFKIYADMENYDKNTTDIANTCLENGDYDLAVKFLKQIYENRRKNLEDKDEQTQVILLCLFKALQMQEKFDEAFEFSYGIHPFEYRVLLQKELAKYLHDTKKYDDSLKFYSELYDRIADKYGPTDPKTLNHKHCIGIVYRSMNRYEDALQTFKEIIEAGLGSLSTLYDLVDFAIRDFAEVLQEIEKADEEIDFIRKIYDDVSAVIGKKHDHSVCILSHTGIALLGQNRYEEAFRCFKTVIDERTKSARLIIPILDIKVMDGFRDSLSFIREANKEIVYLKEITANLEARPKPLHGMTTRLLYILGFTLLKNRRYGESLEVQEKIIELHKILSSDDLNSEVLKAKNIIAFIHLKIGNYKTSYEKFGEVIKKICEKLNKEYKEGEILDKEGMELGAHHSKAIKLMGIAETYINKHKDESDKNEDERGIADRRRMIEELQSIYMDVKSVAPVKIEISTSRRRGRVKRERPRKTELSNLIHEDEGNTALHFAARKNALDVVEVLLNSGANPIKANANGYSPLHYAAYNGNVKMAEAIMNHVKNTNGNKLKDFLDHKNTADGTNALHIACHKGFFDVAKLLLGYGADVQSKS